MIAKFLAAVLFLSSPTADASIALLSYTGTPTVTHGVDDEGNKTETTTYATGYCTAFSINKSKAYWATAAHCVHDGMFLNANMRIMSVIHKDDKTDIAVVVADPRTGAGFPSIKMGKQPKRGDDIIFVGWGMGSVPLFLKGVVQEPVITIQLDTESQEDFLFVSTAGMPGLSGAPVLRNGKVVGMILGGFLHPSPFADFSFATPYAHLKAVLDKYGD